MVRVFAVANVIIKFVQVFKSVNLDLKIFGETFRIWRIRLNILPPLSHAVTWYTAFWSDTSVMFLILCYRCWKDVSRHKKHGRNLLGKRHTHDWSILLLFQHVSGDMG